MTFIVYNLKLNYSDMLKTENFNIYSLSSRLKNCEELNILINRYSNTGIKVVNCKNPIPKNFICKNCPANKGQFFKKTNQNLTFTILKGLIIK